MFFTTNYSNNQSQNVNNNGNFKKGFVPVPDGDYEVYVLNATKGSTPSGKEYMRVEVVVDPQFNDTARNQHAFLQYWKRRNTNQYDPNELMAIARACKVPDGTQFNTEDDFLNAIKGRRAYLHLIIEREEFNGKEYTRNRAFANCWHPSNVNAPVQPNRPQYGQSMNQFNQGWNQSLNQASDQNMTQSDFNGIRIAPPDIQSGDDLPGSRFYKKNTQPAQDDLPPFDPQNDSTINDINSAFDGFDQTIKTDKSNSDPFDPSNDSLNDSINDLGGFPDTKPVKVDNGYIHCSFHDLSQCDSFVYIFKDGKLLLKATPRPDLFPGDLNLGEALDSLHADGEQFEQDAPDDVSAYLNQKYGLKLSFSKTPVDDTQSAPQVDTTGFPKQVKPQTVNDLPF